MKVIKNLLEKNEPSQFACVTTYVYPPLDEMEENLTK